MTNPFSIWRRFSIVLVLSSFLGSCVSQETLGFGSIGLLSSGVINDPANKSLRFDLLKFGPAQFCSEMHSRGVALKLRDGTPNVGRFFASSCQSEAIDEADRQTIVVRYGGRGYGWTNVTGRLGFQTQGLVEFAPDFQMHEGAMYIYFRPRNIDSATFTTTLVESNLANAGIALTGAQPDELGRNLVLSQLQRGFTVIRYSELGETDFGMGLITIGQRPFRPFTVIESDKLTLDNDRTEIHSGQQDYIGGLTVTEDNQAMTITMTLDGAPSVDVVLIPRGTGDTVIHQYTTVAGPAVPTTLPFADVLEQGRPFSRQIPVPKGAYYLLIDHSNRVGRVGPPSSVLDDRAARIDYLVQVGDRS